MPEISQFPRKLQSMFTPSRYRVYYGGRGSGKSWGVARALIIKAYEKPKRILCAREVQRSIKDSVHRLLSDQIKALGLSSQFDVLETEIRGKNGSLFIFTGLSTQTAESLKSIEGVDECWVEEAQSVSKESWQILIPTIRADGSEIDITFNPNLDTDETYQRFVTNPPEGAIVVEMNYNDNPFFPAVLEQERLHCQRTNLEDYEQIWEGRCRTTVAGAIYAREYADAVKGGRISHVPYDPRMKVHTIWDLGWNDSMTIMMVQKSWSEIRVIDCIEDSHRTLDWYVTELRGRKYNWGADYLPHDGANKDFKTGRSAEEILRSFGRNVYIVPKIPIETGIKAARMAWPLTVFDKAKSARLLECLKRYRRSVNQATGEPGVPLHDEYSHFADCFRYYALVADQLSNESLMQDVMLPEFTEEY